jgi:hypothetical protein
VITIVKKKTTTRPPQVRHNHGDREMREETMTAERRQIPCEKDKISTEGRRRRKGKKRTQQTLTVIQNE